MACSSSALQIATSMRSIVVIIGGRTDGVLYQCRSDTSRVMHYAAISDTFTHADGWILDRVYSTEWNTEEERSSPEDNYGHAPAPHTP